MTWGIIPAAGIGSRIQPLAFSKELLPVGSRLDDAQVERPRAVGEYIVERMLAAGADKICFVISPAKTDIVGYFGGSIAGAHVAYVVQGSAGGLCDALFQALPLIAPDEQVLVGLPDTIWYPSDGLARLPDGRLTFLCFPVTEPQHFDAVISEPDGRVREIQVKQARPATSWVWGALKLDGATFAALAALWRAPDRGDTYLGTLVNAWLARGGQAWASHAGTAYVDVGTVHGWRDAVHLLQAQRPPRGEPIRALPRPRPIPR